MAVSHQSLTFEKSDYLLLCKKREGIVSHTAQEEEGRGREDGFGRRKQEGAKATRWHLRGSQKDLRALFTWSSMLSRVYSGGKSRSVSSALSCVQYRSAQDV